jgi:hypothetical protein
MRSAATSNSYRSADNAYSVALDSQLASLPTKDYEPVSSRIFPVAPSASFLGAGLDI